jgi:hypothetical protein
MVQNKGDVASSNFHYRRLPPGSSRETALLLTPQAERFSKAVDTFDNWTTNTKALLVAKRRQELAAMPASSTPIVDRWTWPALRLPETVRLHARLEGKPKAAIQIACNRNECTALADSFDALFKDLGWPSQIVDGGIFAVGVVGLLIAPSDESAEALKDAIDTETDLRPALGKPRDTGTTHPIVLYIGTKEAKK